MLVPYLLGTLLLVALPALMSAALAFTTYDALSPPVFVGLDQLPPPGRRPAGARRPSPTRCSSSCWPCRCASSGRLGLALLLLRPRRGVGGYRAAVYVPTVIPDVAYALIWLWIFNPLFGPVNLALGRLGLPMPAWLADACDAHASPSSSCRCSRSARAS